MKQHCTLFLTLLTFGLLPLQLNAAELTTVFSTDTVFKNISLVKVKGYYAKVAIKQSSDEDVYLNGILKSDKAEGYSISTKITNTALEVWVTYPQSGWSSHTGELQFSVPETVKIQVENTSGYCTASELNLQELKFATKSGKITAKQITGLLDLQSASANIHVDQVKGNVHLKTKSGQTYINEVQGEVAVYSTSGLININKIKGSIKTESTSGKQEMEDCDGDILVKSNSGAIKISMAKGTIQVMGSSGDVQLFQTTGILQINTSKGNQTGSRIVLSGNSSFTSTEGKIKMRFDMPKEALSYQLVSENNFLFALGKSKKKKLNIGNGSIVVTGSSTTGSQSYY
jgi:hypothetical protein